MAMLHQYTKYVCTYTIFKTFTVNTINNYVHLIRVGLHMMKLQSTPCRRQNKTMYHRRLYHNNKMLSVLQNEVKEDGGNDSHTQYPLRSLASISELALVRYRSAPSTDLAGCIDISGKICSEMM